MTSNAIHLATMLVLSAIHHLTLTLTRRRTGMSTIQAQTGQALACTCSLKVSRCSQQTTQN